MESVSRRDMNREPPAFAVSLIGTTTRHLRIAKRSRLVRHVIHLLPREMAEIALALTGCDHLQTHFRSLYKHHSFLLATRFQL